MTAKDAFDDSICLSEETAHRVLARAVELDERDAHAIPLTQLREIATEAGIDPRAFERALAELRTTALPAAVERGAARPGLFKRLWRRVLGRPDHNDRTESLWEGIATNAVAFAAFWALVSLAAGVGDAVGPEWPVKFALVILANVLGLGIALRLRARPAAVVLGVTACASIAQFVMQLRFGVNTVNGGPTQWALMIAGLLGIHLGVLLTRKRRPSHPEITPLAPNEAATDAGPAEQPASRSDPRRLLLRLA